MGGVISQPLGDEADFQAACPSGWTHGGIVFSGAYSIAHSRVTLAP